MSQSLPPIDLSLVPAAVRKAGDGEVTKYESALSFEGMLDQQLAKSLTSTLQGSSDDSSDDGSSTDAATSLTLQMLPQALSQGIVADGGLGLAGQLYTALGGTAKIDGGAR
jgi:Rod binding domain-containing protein